MGTISLVAKLRTPVSDLKSQFRYAMSSELGTFCSTVGEPSWINARWCRAISAEPSTEGPGANSCGGRSVCVRPLQSWL